MSTLKITKENFDTEVLNSDTPILLDFWAEWCGPCKMIGPILEEVSNEVTTAKVGKINIDNDPELAETYNVMSIPTLILIKDGKVSKTSVGAKSKSAIISMIND